MKCFVFHKNDCRRLSRKAEELLLSTPIIYFRHPLYCIRYGFIHFVFMNRWLGFHSHVLVLAKISKFHKMLLKCIVEIVFNKGFFINRKLTQEELEKKRQEMMENAKYDFICLHPYFLTFPGPHMPLYFNLYASISKMIFLLEFQVKSIEPFSYITNLFGLGSVTLCVV